MKTFDDEIRLISLVEGVDDEGFPVVEEGPQAPILANRLSIRSNEFWSAKQGGVTLTYMFEVHSFEYSGEEKLLYRKSETDSWLEHKIERSYVKDDNLTELVCSRKADDHGT